jgi:hypothetical protein
MTFDVMPLGELRAPFRAAIQFGLPEQEAWETMIEVCTRCSLDPSIENPLDELTAALAARILERERGAAQSRRLTG